MAQPSLLAVSDLHIGHKENRQLCEQILPRDRNDWLIVAGDVGERISDIEWALGLLADRFAEVIWVPGNHELWTHPSEESELRGLARYERLVELCRGLGVHTPEDPFLVFEGCTVAPLFTLYDYSFRPQGARDSEEGLAIAHKAGVVCTDEYLLHPDPYPSRAGWCADRIEYSEKRLAEIDGPTVLVNHWPLVREPTDVLWYPEFAQWCGTTESRDWARRFDARAVVYGHLHIPRTITVDGVPHVEASLGYPREWRRHGMRPELYVDVFDPVRPNLETVGARVSG
ncbi:metallophosphoesterase family protein [Sciscionella sediminilitoris]|uniref:metallophosphoesterase family protein n=1 Tax=Sciscionella sediminilitoris TaxID=1445613 RepID=UPI0004DF2FD6|nr:metallophosphoesterase [Sciscionella sp. SE31]